MCIRDRSEEKRRGIRTKGSQGNSRDAQLKWYLHWRRYATTELGFGVTTLNQKFTSYCWKIHKEEQFPPEGFDKKWFEAALGRKADENGKLTIITRALSETLKRHKSNPKYHEFLAASPQDDPKTPPLAVLN